MSEKISILTSLNASKDITKKNIPQIKSNQIFSFLNAEKLKRITSLNNLNSFNSTQKRALSNCKRKSNDEQSLLLKILASKRNSGIFNKQNKILLTHLKSNIM